MRSIKLTVAYDGTAYAGWQLQPDRPTIQGALEQTLERITGQAVRVTGSSRTDAGVHALGQVVSFRTESDLSADVLQRALNAELPRDIVVSAAVETEAEFHAIRDTLSKRYRYVIQDGGPRDVFVRGYSWYLPLRLDVEAMHRAAQMLMGTHDFASFETSGSERESSVRTITDISVARIEVENSPRVVLEVEADGFLYNMVRTIVGTLVEIGRGNRPETWMTEVLVAGDRRAAAQTAPPQGLFLLRVVHRASVLSLATEK